MWAKLPLSAPLELDSNFGYEAKTLRMHGPNLAALYQQGSLWTARNFSLVARWS